ncbi:iron complex transport system substrate-binding protein [Clostridium sp. DSM 8431]|uniref:iron-hydroxamate ABC transporter substrate-binding protein n=1 Tax=Clostridium sp. DSM 8431 TaxID=1761781 RepID=UPI0008E0F255|nr:iron-hydroxamate ABC transporter substrate-binding protein [Clostridium sp. DSM 8431]SFU58522.1 iron complex transport system substrate-binding protein [Clostridium sp. DSM 8431]
MKKKFLKLAALSCVTLLMFAGCSSSKSNEDKTAETVTVTDVKGEVEIPANPKRIVDLSGNSDLIEELGGNVVGTANTDAYNNNEIQSFIADKLSDAEVLGYSMQAEMDVEKIMNLNPDLIIISTYQEKMYDTLSEIAPTVMVQLDALDWKQDVLTFGKILNKESEAQEWLSNYEEKATAEGDKIKEEFGANTTYLSILASGGQIYVYDNAGLGSILYNDMGLAKPEGMPAQSDISLPVVTYEGLAAIKADYIFVMGTDDDLAQLESNPIWNSIPAVQQGHVVVLPATPYFSKCYTIVGRELLLGEIGEKLNATK